jgi:hypothetical protein
MAGNARQFHTQQTHYLRLPFAWNTTNVASGVKVGTLPAGARVLRQTTYIETAFNAGSTNTVSIGYSAGGTDILNAGPAGSQAMLTTAVPIAANSGVNLSADTDVFVTYAQTGGAASAGAGTVVIEYVPNV